MSPFPFHTNEASQIKGSQHRFTKLSLYDLSTLRHLNTLRPRKYPPPPQGYCRFCHVVQLCKTERDQNVERKDDVTFFIFPTSD